MSWPMPNAPMMSGTATLTVVMANTMLSTPTMPEPVTSQR
jgi:hypothetical protein